jgi:hypothetical protein
MYKVFDLIVNYCILASGQGGIQMLISAAKCPYAAPSIIAIIQLCLIFNYSQIKAQETDSAETSSRKKIAVLSLSYADEIGDAFAQQIVAVFSDMLAKSDSLAVTDRAVVEATLREQQISESCSDAQCAAEAGRALGASHIVYGIVEKRGYAPYLSLFVVDVENERATKELQKAISGDSAKLKSALSRISALVISHVCPKAASKVSVASHAKARLKIFTNPPNAAVMLQKENVGFTPFESEPLNAGTYAVEISKQGYRRFSRSIYLKPGVEKKMLVKLASLMGAVTVLSEPSGAKVTVGDSTVGNTPVFHKALPGDYSISLALKGYLPEKRKIYLGENRHDTLSFSLMSQAAADSLRLKRKKGFQMFRRIAFGVLSAGFIGLGYYNDTKVEDCLHNEQVARRNYETANLSQSQYDTYWEEYEKATNKTDSMIRRRDVYYGIAAGCVLGLGISIFF